MSTEFQTKYGPWALVAGASEGLGAEFARQAAARGLNVVIVARRGDVLAELKKELEQAHRVQVRPLALDLADHDSPEELLAAVADLEIGLLVHNAAYAPAGPFLELSAEDNLRAVALNVRTPVALAHAFGKPMAERHRGGIVLLSSLTAFQGSPYLSTYGATKAFNLTLGEGLWWELKLHGVDVLAVCAGATRTPKMIASMPQGAPGMLEPDAVVTDALNRLGRGPTTIAGAFNKTASFFLRRFLSRRTAISIMAKQGPHAERSGRAQ